MSDVIIGCMWAKNEGDIIAQTIEAALAHPDIDGLLIADDDSDDNTWDVIKSYKSKLLGCYRRRDHREVDRYSEKVWARAFLMDEVRRRFGCNDSWIQIIESDIMVFETSIREMIEKIAVQDCIIYWQTLNACRRDWTDGGDKWPNWDMPLQEIMPDCHWMELMPYTYRPLEKIYYDDGPRKPWPRGFTNYNVTMRKTKTEHSPLLMHYGFRGPTHYAHKVGKTVEEVLADNPFFNGTWNDDQNHTYPASRRGWKNWLEFRKAEIKWRKYIEENS